MGKLRTYNEAVDAALAGEIDWSEVEVLAQRQLAEREAGFGPQQEIHKDDDC